MRGYVERQSRRLSCDLGYMPADVTCCEGEVQARFNRGAHLPIIAASGLLDVPVAVPWWNGMSLRMEAWVWCHTPSFWHSRPFGMKRGGVSH